MRGHCHPQTKTESLHRVGNKHRMFSRCCLFSEYPDLALARGQDYTGHMKPPSTPPKLGDGG